MSNLVALSVSVGANVGWLQALAVPDLDPSVGLAAWPTLAAHYDPVTWQAIGGTLQDTLRERRRDALVGYLGANPTKLGLPGTSADSDAMLGQLLVDVEMGSCRSSTRLDLAINSVQLFLQRCQLGLEPNVTLTPDDVTEWSWMSDYQTWAADRQTFVYPENYLDPTLRSDVTELFTDLQKQLQQADLTDVAAEDAMLTYLHGLDAIANLEPAAVLRDVSLSEQTSTTGPTTEALTLGETHLVSRSRSSPHAYYHRTYDKTRGWAPWETINVDIDADNLLPGILNGQFYLFWPQFLDAADEDISQDAAGTAKGTAPSRSRQLRLAWTQLRNGEWTPKQVASGPDLDQHTDTYSLDLASFFLRGDNLRALRYPSAAYAIVPFWYQGTVSGSSKWSLRTTGTLSFAPGSLSVSTNPPLSAPLITGGVSDLFNAIQEHWGPRYYVLTVLMAGGYESAPSPEVLVTQPTTPPGNGFIPVITWSVDPSLPVTYRVYEGPAAGQENSFWQVTSDSGRTTASFRDDPPMQGFPGTPGSPGTPPKAGWVATPPRTGSPRHTRRTTLPKAPRSRSDSRPRAEPAAGASRRQWLSRPWTRTRSTPSPGSSHRHFKRTRNRRPERPEESSLSLASVSRSASASSLSFRRRSLSSRPCPASRGPPPTPRLPRFRRRPQRPSPQTAHAAPARRWAGRFRAPSAPAPTTAQSR